MHPIAEKDWKRLRAKQEEKLDQVCGNIINNIKAAMPDQKHGHHKAYLDIWDIIHAGDAKIAEMFDDLRRSNAVFKLASWQKNGLLNEDELKEFSEETQASIAAINS
jgi:hypothetical protein